MLEAFRGRTTRPPGRTGSLDAPRLGLALSRTFVLKKIIKNPNDIWRSGNNDFLKVKKLEKTSSGRGH
jgi:hypothetical protein